MVTPPSAESHILAESREGQGAAAQCGQRGVWAADYWFGAAEAGGEGALANPCPSARLSRDAQVDGPPSLAATSRSSAKPDDAADFGTRFSLRNNVKYRILKSKSE